MRFFLPAFTDELVDGETSESPEPPGEVVGCNEVGEVCLELVVAVVAVTLNGGFLAAFHFRQTADAMPFQTAMQRRTGQLE